MFFTTSLQDTRLVAKTPSALRTHSNPSSTSVRGRGVGRYAMVLVSLS